MSVPHGKWHLDTQAVHAGERVRFAGAAVTPIFQSSTYIFDGDTARGYDAVKYARCNNTPNHDVLAEKLAALENTKAAMVTSSGMAAISTTLMTLLKSGDHLLVQQSLYGGTEMFLTNDLPDWGVTLTRVDADKPESWSAALQPNTKVFYIETISNPLLEIPDLPAVAAFCQENHLTSVIDNTFASPAVIRQATTKLPAALHTHCIAPPAELGIDVVIESATKYLNGHADIIAGAVAGSTKFMQKFISRLNHMGGCLDMHACFLLQRGLKTLPLRVRQQSANALALAQFLEKQPQVSRVLYPGLTSNPYYPRIQKLFGGQAGGVVTFELLAGAAAAEMMFQALKIPLVAPSLGGVESLITRPVTTTHVGMSQEERQRCGISDGLVRVACGVEATADLIEDFELALASIGAKANALSLGSSNGPRLGQVLQNAHGIDEAVQAVEEAGLGKTPSEAVSGSLDVNVSQLNDNKKIAQQI
ncbi:hypothetical protein ABBQ38_009680 [Trebouxia sp. C0009 RCD-2024]